MKGVKVYCHAGRNGCVQLRKSQIFKVHVGVYRADQAGLDGDGGPWVSICEDHGAVCNHATLKVVLEQAPWLNWCEVCQGSQ